MNAHSFRVVDRGNREAMKRIGSRLGLLWSSIPDALMQRHSERIVGRGEDPGPTATRRGAHKPVPTLSSTVFQPRRPRPRPSPVGSAGRRGPRQAVAAPRARAAGSTPRPAASHPSQRTLRNVCLTCSGALCPMPSKISLSSRIHVSHDIRILENMGFRDPAGVEMAGRTGRP